MNNEGKWVVELEPGVWLATTEGDPGRTLKRENARLYNHPGGADIALQNARKYRPFENARVLPAEMEYTSQGIDMTDQRIKLAEFVGWTWVGRTESWMKGCGYWVPPTGNTTTDTYSNFQPPPFRPRNSADDCEALIRKLGDIGIGTDIYRRPWMGSESVTVYVQGEPIEWKECRWSGDDYKHGVCDLAEKIIEQQEQDGE